MRTEDGGPKTEVAKLTATQRRVLTRIGQGRMTKEIAAELQLTERGVKWHREQIYTKLNLAGLADAVRAAVKLGLVVL